jgi:hypothetical protein
MDTYDFARRAEILGIGRWGNQQTKGAICRGDELGSALVDVLIGGRSSLYTARAKELARLCKRSGGGRVVAARRILAEILYEPEDDEEEKKVETGKISLNGKAEESNGKVGDEKTPLLANGHR